jgi:hypothetical protein
VGPGEGSGDLAMPERSRVPAYGPFSPENRAAPLTNGRREFRSQKCLPPQVGFEPIPFWFTTGRKIGLFGRISETKTAPKSMLRWSGCDRFTVPSLHVPAFRSLSPSPFVIGRTSTVGGNPGPLAGSCHSDKTSTLACPGSLYAFAGELVPPKADRIPDASPPLAPVSALAAASPFFRKYLAAKHFRLACLPHQSECGVRKTR